MILVTGGYGFLGSEVCRRLDEEKISYYRFKSSEYDLRDKTQAKYIFSCITPKTVIHAAARLGGIKDNVENPFYYYSDNLKIGLNVTDCCISQKVENLININTACSYPLNAKQPFSEKDINGGLPASANMYYGLSKRAVMNYTEIASKTYGFKVSNLILSNMFGINDDFNEQTSHVIPALIKKIHKAKEENTALYVWGNPEVTRDFITNKFAANVIVEALKTNKEIGRCNVATGVSVSIQQIVHYLCSCFDYQGQIIWEESKPTGQPLRSMDTSRFNSIFNLKPNDFFVDLKKLCSYFVDNKEEILNKSKIEKYK